MKIHGRVLANPVMAALLGVFAWNDHILALSALPLLVYLWRRASSRADALIVAAAYYLAAARGLFHGAGVFFGTSDALPAWAYGALVWIVPNILLACVWAGLWGNTHRALRLLAILFIVSVPPIGVVGWANPVTAA